MIVLEQLKAFVRYVGQVDCLTVDWTFGCECLKWPIFPYRPTLGKIVATGETKYYLL